MLLILSAASVSFKQIATKILPAALVNSCFKSISYRCRSRLALVRPAKDVERGVARGVLALVDVHAPEIDVDATRAPGRES